MRKLEVKDYTTNKTKQIKELHCKSTAETESLNNIYYLFIFVKILKCLFWELKEEKEMMSEKC
jgi:hypothetical protein